MDNEVVNAVARIFYAPGVTIDCWDQEQEHLKYAFYDAARDFLARLDAVGLMITRKPEPEEAQREPEPEKPKVERPARKLPTKKSVDVVPETEEKGPIAKELKKSFEE